MMIGGAGLRAASAQGRDFREISGRQPGGPVVLLFDLPFELPHCLSVSPHNAKSRVPNVTRMGDQDFAVHPVFHKRQHAPNVQEP